MEERLISTGLTEQNIKSSFHFVLEICHECAGHVKSLCRNNYTLAVVSIIQTDRPWTPKQTSGLIVHEKKINAKPRVT